MTDEDSPDFRDIDRTTAWWVGTLASLAKGGADAISTFLRMALSTPNVGESVKCLSDRAQRSSSASFASCSDTVSDPIPSEHHAHPSSPPSGYNSCKSSMPPLPVLSSRNINNHTTSSLYSLHSSSERTSLPIAFDVFTSAVADKNRPILLTCNCLL